MTILIWMYQKGQQVIALQAWIASLINFYFVFYFQILNLILRISLTLVIKFIQNATTRGTRFFQEKYINYINMCKCREWHCRRLYFKRNQIKLDTKRNYVHKFSRWNIFEVSIRTNVFCFLFGSHVTLLKMCFHYSMLKALIIPLLVASITSAIGSLDLKMSGKIARR